MLVDLRRAIWWVPVALVITNCFVVGNFVSTVMSALDRKSTRRNSSHLGISYAVFCLKKKSDQTEEDAGAAGLNELRKIYHSIGDEILVDYERGDSGLICGMVREVGVVVMVDVALDQS